jgi:hypothetical protein
MFSVNEKKPSLRISHIAYGGQGGLNHIARLKLNMAI